MQQAEITCPHCQTKQSADIPQNNTCLAFYKCQSCGKTILPKECCVVCDYSDQACPISAK